MEVVRQTRPRMRMAALVLLALLGLTGCPANDGPDEPCNATSDCQSGLQCVAPSTGQVDGGSCTSLNKRCTKSCTTDKDCNYPGGGTCLLRGCTDDSSYCLANGL